MKAKGINKLIPISRLIPSIITLLSLCMGISAIRYAILGNTQVAVALILIAGFLDGIDGRIARLLNCSSDFGAQLDSLADMVSFGVAPAIILYFWKLQYLPYNGLGWAIVLFFSSCSALRLARFNSQLDNNAEEQNQASFSAGIPMPAAAGIVVMPIMLNFQLTNYDFNPIAIVVHCVIVGIMMVSTTPTFSGKKMQIKRGLVPILMLIVAAIFAFAILEPWIILPLIGLIYITSIPFSMFLYYRSVAEDDKDI